MGLTGGGNNPSREGTARAAEYITMSMSGKISQGDLGDVDARDLLQFRTRFATGV